MTRAGWSLIAFVFALAVAISTSAPGCKSPTTDEVEEDLGTGEARLTRVQSKAEEEPYEEEADEKMDEDDGEEEGGTGVKMALEEGKMGKKDSDREAGRYALENKGIDPQLARAQAMDKARQSGIAGALQGNANLSEAPERLAPTRAWFPETFLFNPLVVTDDKGDASLEVRVPDRLTE